MAIYVIRHAHAGSRQQWNGDDFDRPLSATGRDEAKKLTELLADEPIGRIFSSPATRCIETVEPLASALSLPITTATELAEGADANIALARLLAHADENPAACTHGDVVPKMIRHLKVSGMHSTDPTESAKGSVWILDVDGGTVVRGSYHVPR